MQHVLTDGEPEGLRPSWLRAAGAVEGEVLGDAFSRGRYATDASIYQVMPRAVVVPRTMADVEASLAIARKEGVPLLPRGGGTSQCGQTVNDAVVIDFTKHLNRLLSRRCRRGHRRGRTRLGAGSSERRLKPHGLWYPVDVSTASRATLGGMAANNSCGSRSIRYGTMRDNVLAIDALLADGARMAFGRCRATCAASTARARVRPVPRRCWTWASREAGGDRGPLSRPDAPGRRLQHRRPGAQRRHQQPLAPAGRLRGHPGDQREDHAEALAPAAEQGARGLPFPQLLRRHGRGPAPGDPRPDGGRAGRPHHDRAGPRHSPLPPHRRALRARRAGGAAAGGIRRGKPGREPAPPEGAGRHDGRAGLPLGRSGQEARRRGGGHRSGLPEGRSSACAPRASTS